MSSGKSSPNSAVPFAGALASLAVFPLFGDLSAEPSAPVEVAAVHADTSAEEAAEAHPLAARLATADAKDNTSDEATRPTVRLYARDLQDGTEIAEEAGAPVMSTAGRKVAVVAAGLHHLGPEYRFHTRYYARGRKKDDTLWGDLLVRGIGDPTVDDVRLRWLTRQMALSGLTRITGSVVLDDSLLAAPALEAPEPDEPEGEGEGESEESESEADAGPDDTPVEEPADDDDDDDDAIEAEATGPAAFHFDNDEVVLTIRPDAPGRPAGTHLSPDVGFVRVTGSVSTADFDRRPRAVASIGQKGGTIHVSGAIGKDSPSRRYTFAVKDPRFYFGRALVTHLRHNGIKVRSKVSVTPRPGRRRRMFVDVSPPLTELCERALHQEGKSRGDAIIDAVLRVLAAEHEGVEGREQNGAAVVEKFMSNEVRLKKARLGSVNAPGLSPSDVVSVLAWGRGKFELKSEFLRSFGPASTHPLLRHQIKDPKLRRNLRATVTVAGARIEMVGFVKATSGHDVAFAFVVDGDERGLERAWSEVNARLENISRMGGKAPPAKKSDAKGP